MMHARVAMMPVLVMKRGFSNQIGERNGNIAEKVLDHRQALHNLIS